MGKHFFLSLLAVVCQLFCNFAPDEYLLKRDDHFLLNILRPVIFFLYLIIVRNDYFLCNRICVLFNGKMSKIVSSIIPL